MRGSGNNMPAIIEFAKEHNLWVLEDSVPTCGINLSGKKLGTFGHIGAFSIQGRKSINAGEGGFLLFNDETLYQKAVSLSGAYQQHFFRHLAGQNITINIVPEITLFSIFV